ncbi:MAG: SAM-dependent methyltransferase [Bryobacteraceae bacterium]
MSARNPLSEILAARIRRTGPLRFSEFMEAALYDPEYGYYSAARRAVAEPTGAAGDYYTATQVQPVFGRLARAAVAGLCSELRLPEPCTVADWGAGRALMRESFGGFHYVAVEAGRPAPPPFEGIVFANELFDALPVDVARCRHGEARLLRVDFHDGAFRWVSAEPPAAQWLEYIRRLAPHFRESVEFQLELPVRMEPELRRIGGALKRGAMLVIDYGYIQREIVRFPRGTLMSYRRHTAHEDVLRDPGLQDITAHVPFTFLEQLALDSGWTSHGVENFSSWLLRAGGPDHFGSALAAGSEAEAAQLRLQLKTLLFGMGESFRCLRLDKAG